jgi:hypothetical protein
MNRPTQDIVNTLVHELTHIVDKQHSYTFGHGSNNPKGKEMTAPYLLGKLAQEYAYTRRLYDLEDLVSLRERYS